nr:UDP-N-acetylmuramate dehydrogenase [Vibrio sp. Isolate33]
MLKFTTCKVYKDVDVKDIAYWKVGGACDFIIYPRSVKDIEVSINVCKNNNLDYEVIGNASNLLFTSSKISGVLIILSDVFAYIKKVSDSEFEVGASSSVPWTAYVLGARGYQGIEHCIGIPGTMGGLVYMNGGAQRKAIGDNIVKVKAFCYKTLSVVELYNSECLFSYRSSIFQSDDYLILSVTINVARINNTRALKAEMLSTLRDRRSKFPLDYPSCGSVFQSKTNVFEMYGPPGKIIEELGLKGLSVGGAQISNKHANFIINKGDASSEDIISLVKRVRDDFYKLSNLKLPTEVYYLDEFLNKSALSNKLDNE